MDQNWTQKLPFYDNRVLFGQEATPGIIACELEGQDRVRIYSRQGDKVSSESQTFQPILLIEDEKWMKGWKGELQLETLEGSAPLKHLLRFSDLKVLDSAKSHLQKKTGKGVSAPDAPYLYFGDPVHLYLLTSGKTHFLEMAFGKLRRMQLDIETYCAPGFEFPNAERESDRVTAIALSDSTGWEKLISGKDLDEAEMLSEMVKTVQERDPDVIEGHNFFRFDLEYLEARARRHGVKLKLGRDGSVVSGHPSRMQIAERSITYRKYEIFGRHIIDTWILAQHFDVATRELSGYGLKEIARHFGIASSDRTYVPGDKVSWYFDHDPDTLFRYALDDVRETRAISELLSPSYFVEAQVFPYSYQNVALRGNATKINSLFLREYLHRRHSIPRPDGGQAVVGGYTDIEYQGVANNVLHCDVTSLYPSIMLAYDFSPKKDELKVFPSLLSDLRDFRISAKQMAREAKTKETEIYFSSLQSTFKILINSFYGYLGFSMGHFNDFEAANQVTAKGRELIQSAVALLKKKGAQIIEIDTDGIYFVPPKGVKTQDDEDKLIQNLADSLPKGIDLELDGRYPAMFSYKMKNYALLDEKGRLVIKGSGLRSRGMELFQRQWLEEMLLLLLRGEKDKIPGLYDQYLDDLEQHRMDISLLMKTESLQDSLDNYQAKVKAKKRNAAAAYELALSSQRPYQPGDQISYYVTGKAAKVKINENSKLAAQWDPANPDENVAHYKAKLKELYEKFKPLVE
ncbi:MAG: DNA polymerase II [Deltaproteobacteria bacterium]|nr:DNA polymerase II [Deltaproteobacteria bacterium]